MASKSTNDNHRYVDPDSIFFWEEMAKGIVPPTPKQYQDMKVSIDKDGQNQPVLIDEANRIIDGWNRTQICKELGRQVWVEPLFNRSFDEKRAVALGNNGARRHVSEPDRLQMMEEASQRRQRVLEAHERGESLRKIAAQEGVSKSTIENDLDALEESGVHPRTPEKVTGLDGKEQASKKQKKGERLYNRILEVWSRNPSKLVVVSGVPWYDKLIFHFDAKRIAALLGTEPVYLREGPTANLAVLKIREPHAKKFFEFLTEQGIDYVVDNYIRSDFQSDILTVATSLRGIRPPYIVAEAAPPAPTHQETTAPAIFPVAFGKTFIVTDAVIKVGRWNSYIGSSTKTTRTYGVTLEANGKSGNQQNLYPVTFKHVEGDQIELSTGGATKVRIPLADWQAFADQLPVEVSAISKTTITHTPLLAKMCRDVIAYRREAPTEADWLAEEAAAAEMTRQAAADLAYDRAQQTNTLIEHPLAGQPEQGAEKPASYELYTPAWLIERVREALGGTIELDPASCEAAQQIVKAEAIYTIDDNGLLCDWYADTVFVNHPYGRGFNEDWAEKIVEEHRLGRAKKILALIPVSTSAGWFIRFRDFPRIFLHSRVDFWGPADQDMGARFDSAIIALGFKDLGLLAQAFGDKGDLYQGRYIP